MKPVLAIAQTLDYERLDTMLKLQPNDTALYPRSESDILMLLHDATQDGDPARLVGVLAEIAHSRNMSRLARDCGLSRGGLIKALAPDGNPGFLTIAKVAQVLGLRIVIARQEQDAKA